MGNRHATVYVDLCSLNVLIKHINKLDPNYQQFRFYTPLKCNYTYTKQKKYSYKETCTYKNRNTLNTLSKHKCADKLCRLFIKMDKNIYKKLIILMQQHMRDTFMYKSLESHIHAPPCYESECVK